MNACKRIASSHPLAHEISAAPIFRSGAIHAEKT
ncbi:Uncharacterised protein [Bordetella pertussis]|nr:Uncharacterised protein [Bordetella pertussis]CFW30397.1 Uncharacterised protein [Bordetella pertussis]